MKAEACRAAAAWLREYTEAHGIVSVGALRHLGAPFAVADPNVVPGACAIGLGTTSHGYELLPIYRPDEQRAAIARRGLGGFLAPDAGLTFNGWEAAETLARACGLGSPGAIVGGRGSKWRLCLAALERAAQLEAVQP